MINLVAPHEARETEKLAALVADMTVNGWTGRPVLACENGHALTGSHRIAAAKVVGIDVPYVLVPGEWDWSAVDFENLLWSFDEFVADLRANEEELPENWEAVRELLVDEG